MELTELANYLDEEVQVRCAGDKSIEGPEDGFTAVMLEYLSKGNEVDAWELGYAKKPGRRNAPAYKINAWNLHEQTGDQAGSAPLVDLFVSIYKAGATGQSVTKSEVAEHFEMARNFLTQALTAFGGRLQQMEESAPPFEAATKILAHRDDLDTARIFLLTNGVAKQCEEKDTDVDGVEVKHYLWDLEKLRRLLSSGQEREVIQIDLVKDYGGAIPCLAQDDGTDEYTAYLAFFPANLLAKIYGDFGPRLLEKNVRSFLQAKGKVNKGIQATVRDAPHRFLAYNNGISGTAESVTTSRTKDGLCKLELLRDFQIVNGGQTTASIYHAMKKDNADISHVTVQVKLTVVKEAEKMADFVPLISLYANSQNKVNTADFSANDVWHQKLESLSRTVWAPAMTGTGKGTHWYYERARGSHLDDKMRMGTTVTARRKQWESENPVSQKFTKTDVAKYEHTWNQLPHIVSKGAEKNFNDWTLARLKAGAKLPEQADFEALCAKALLFRGAEKLIGGLDLGGYRANVVAYTLAWLSRATSGRVDLRRIWQKQAAGEAIQIAIKTVAPFAYKHLVDYAAGRNVTEMAKREECWMNFRDTKIELPPLNADLESSRRDSSAHMRTTSQAQGPRLSASELQEGVQRVRRDVWLELASWGAAEGCLMPWQVTICRTLHGKLQRGARLKQDECKGLLDVLHAARAKGFNN
ncbi:MAG: AIPR family protein [Verrucomicrobia bacterium]|nr:AIPR family protein [Verrucomicrobiota bacterium]